MKPYVEEKLFTYRVAVGNDQVAQMYGGGPSGAAAMAMPA